MVLLFSVQANQAIVVQGNRLCGSEAIFCSGEDGGFLYSRRAASRVVAISAPSVNLRKRAAHTASGGPSSSLSIRADLVANLRILLLRDNSFLDQLVRGAVGSGRNNF